MLYQLFHFPNKETTVFFVARVRMLKAIKKTQNHFLGLTGSRRSSSASRGAVLAFGCTSSLHSLSEAGGDSARSGKSSLVLGPRKRILSRRFSMVNTAHLGFTLTWWTATLQGQKTKTQPFTFVCHFVSLLNGFQQLLHCECCNMMTILPFFCILIHSVEAVEVGEQCVLCVTVVYAIVLLVCEASSKKTKCCKSRGHLKRNSN